MSLANCYNEQERVHLARYLLSARRRSLHRLPERANNQVNVLRAGFVCLGSLRATVAASWRSGQNAPVRKVIDDHETFIHLNARGKDWRRGANEGATNYVFVMRSRVFVLHMLGPSSS